MEKSAEAMDEALKFMENATNVEVWVQAAYTNKLLGKNERAAQTLGTIIRNFPSYHGIARINFHAAVLLLKLKRFDQACAHLLACMQHGGTEPYSMNDLQFFMSRFYENWAKTEAEESKMEIAMQGYRKVFNQKLERGDTTEESVEAWLNNTDTWREYGDRCSMGGHFVFTADLFKEAIMKDPSKSEKNSKLHFGLSKAYYRCGSIGKAIKKAKDAIAMNPNNTQMQVTLDAWKNPVPHFKEDVALSIGELLGVYMDGKQHPSHAVRLKHVKTQEMLDVRSKSKRIALVQRESQIVKLESTNFSVEKEKRNLPWYKLKLHIQEAARQYYKIKIHQMLVYHKTTGIEMASGELVSITKMTAVLGLLCFDSNPAAKASLLRASAVLLQKASEQVSE